MGKEGGLTGFSGVRLDLSDRVSENIKKRIASPRSFILVFYFQPIKKESVPCLNPFLK
jgi:hypothetical protein